MTPPSTALRVPSPAADAATSLAAVGEAKKPSHLDVIIVGAGHNGLVAGAYLARAGRKVLVLEARDTAGGQLGAVSYGPGFEAPALHPAARLRPQVVRELELVRFGLGAESRPAPYVTALPDGRRLHLVADPNDQTTLESIRQLSPSDADRWPEFVAFMDKATRFVDAAYATGMPRLPKVDWRTDGIPLAGLAWKLRGLGRRDMFRVVRSLPMTAVEFTEEWFESEPLKAAIGALAVHGLTIGSMSAGGGLNLIHQWLLRDGLGHRAGSDTHVLADALTRALQTAGGQVRTGSPVAQILVERQRAVGVRLASGEEIRAQAIISAADPRHTLLGLIGAPELPPEFVWHTQSIRMRGSVAKVHVLTDGHHGLPEGTVVIAPTLKYIERAYDAAKYGQVSEQPYLEVTTHGTVVSIHYQFAPYALRNEDWAQARATVERRAVSTLTLHFPSFGASVRDVHAITPLDLERQWGLTEGDLNHGQLILDQVLFMRPIPGWSNHRTPIDGLYLCGSGVHGGGGISGHAGRNAARAILKE